MSIEISEPRTEQEFEECYRLRYERLRKPHGQPPGSERTDPAESASTHLIARIDGRIVGSFCWAVGMHRDETTGQRNVFVRFRQLAVEPEFEGRGIGRKLLEAGIERARAIGATEIHGNVRAELVPWFESIGFIEVGPGETLFGTVEHVAMVIPLQ
jgi:GNAT superfamily N-acetyltransferase